MAGTRPARARLRLALVGVSCLAAAAALGAALFHTHGDVAFDRLGARVIGPPSPVSGPMAIALARLGDRNSVALLLLLVAGAAAVMHRRAGPVIVVLATGLATQGLVLFGKRLVGRTLFGLGSSYPSGHVAGAAVVLALAVLTVRHRGPLTSRLVGAAVSLVPLGTTVGAIWTQSHVWTEVVGGALVGVGTPLVLWAGLVAAEPDPSKPAASDGSDPSLLRSVANAGPMG